MTFGRHSCLKRKDDPTYSPQWSGVSWAPHCPHGCTCRECGEPLHLEGDAHYCPAHDDFMPKQPDCREEYWENPDDR